LEEPGITSYCRKSTLFLIQAPDAPTTARDEEKYETVEGRQFAFVYGRKKLRAELELPVHLKISHSHFTAGKEGRQAGLETHHHKQAAT